MSESHDPALDEKHRELLEKLARDDAFRESFAKNAGEILLKYRWLDRLPEEFPSEVKVPSKESLEAALRSGDHRCDFLPTFSPASFCFGSFAPEPEPDPIDS